MMMRDINEVKIVLKKQIDGFLNIFPKELSTFISDNCYLAGGCFVSLTHEETVIDYDIYFKSEKSLNWFVENKHRFDKHLKEIIDTPNAVTYQTYAGILGKSQKYQFIKKLYGSPFGVIMQFDFDHCMNYYDISKDEIFFRNIRAVNDKILIYNTTAKFKYKALERYFKFTSSRGFRKDITTFQKILKEVNTLDLSNKDVIKEQEIGLYDVSEKYSKRRYMTDELEKQKLWKSNLEDTLND